MQRGLRSRKNSGFTLIEVALAAAVMALAIVSSIQVMGRGFASLDTARRLSFASQIMQSELEKMRLTSWSVVSAYPATSSVPINSALYTGTGDLGSSMSMTRDTEVVHVGMIKVTLTISWSTFDGRRLQRSYITYYGKDALYDGFIT